MSEEIKKDSVYNVMRLIYKLLKKQNLISEVFLQRTIHFDASTKQKFDQLTEEDKLVWYMVMLLFKIIFEEAGNYYKYKEKDPEKFVFLNDYRPFYQSMNRVDLTRSAIFEQAVSDIKQLSFDDLKRKTGVTVDPKDFGNVVRGDVNRRTQEI